MADPGQGESRSGKIEAERKRSGSSRERKVLLALVSSSAISYTGNVVAAVALPWFVLETTGSAAKTGIVAFFATGPYAVGALFGGSIADGLGRKRSAVLADVVSGAAVAAIPALHITGTLRFWHLVVFALAGAVFDAPGMAARKSMVPDIADRAGTSVERATSFLTTAEHAGYLLGAPLAGGLIALVGAPGALWVDAASFGLSALVTLFGVPSLVTTRREEQPYWREFAEGLRFLWRDRLLVWLFAVHSFGNMLTAPIAPVLLPVFAKRVFDSPGKLGVMVAVYGVGGIAGTALLGVAGQRLPRRTAYRAAFLVYPVVIFGLSTLPAFALVMGLLLVLGVFAGLVVPVEETVIHERATGEMRTRLFGTFMAAAMTLGPLGVLGLGFVIEALGLRSTLVILGLGYTVLAVAAMATMGRRR